MPNSLRLAASTLSLLVLAACSDGAAGPAGPAGSAGSPGAAGAPGSTGPAGSSVPPVAGDAGPPPRPADPALLELPGATFYPESITAAKDGALFVGSIAGGGIVKFEAGTRARKTFAAPGTVKGVAGVFADDDTNTLFACDVDTQATPPVSVVRAFDLASGAAKASYPFPTPGFCNDFTRDTAGNVYVTDSFGKIYVLRKNATALASWSTDTKLAPLAPTGFGADGISFDGTSALYVNTFTDNGLLRIAIQPDGSAGAVTTITVTPALSGPDGMRQIDATTLLVVEGAGRLSRVKVTGATAQSTPIANRLDSPTGVAVSAGSYWVTEGQLPRLFFNPTNTPPNLPFLVRRFDAQ
jgi:sugar lactone lactonase YvrE